MYEESAWRQWCRGQISTRRASPRCWRLSKIARGEPVEPRARPSTGSGRTKRARSPFLGGPTSFQARGHRSQFGGNAGHRLIARVALFRHHLAEHRIDLVWRRMPRAWRKRSGQHFEHDDSERKDVGPLVENVIAPLLRRHVREILAPNPFVTQPRCQAEVDRLGASLLADDD